MGESQSKNDWRPGFFEEIRRQEIRRQEREIQEQEEAKKKLLGHLHMLSMLNLLSQNSEDSEEGLDGLLQTLLHSLVLLEAINGNSGLLQIRLNGSGDLTDSLNGMNIKYAIDSEASVREKQEKVKELQRLVSLKQSLLDGYNGR